MTVNFELLRLKTRPIHIDEVKLKIPDLQVGFEIDEFENLTLHDDLIASVHVCWRMVFPNSLGASSNQFFNLANMDGRLGNYCNHIVDRGFEEKGMNIKLTTPPVQPS